MCLYAAEVPFSDRHHARSCAQAPTLGPLQGVKDDDRCPQLEVIAEARKGHVGASLALLRERAVGRRVRVLWPYEKKFFTGAIVGFDPELYLHRFGWLQIYHALSCAPVLANPLSLAHSCGEPSV